MKTVTINTAGKRATAYTTETVPTSVRLNGELKTKISVKEARELIGNRQPWHEGVNYQTYKIEE